MTIAERIDDQEARIIELIKENSQLKRDGLALEAIIAENNKLKREMADRTKTPVTGRDWEIKIADVRSKYKGKAIAEGKLRKKVERLEAKNTELQAQLEEAQNTPPQQHPKPKLCIVKADYKVFGDLDDAYKRIDSLLKENEAYRDICSNLEEENQLLKLELEEKPEVVMSHTDEEIQSYEELLTESNSQLMEAQDEITELRKRIQILEGKIQSKEIMYNSFKEKNGASIIVEGAEEDLYPGEQRDIILSYIKEKMQSLPKNTRQYHVCKSLLEANPENGTRGNIRRRVFDGLKDIKHVFSGTRLGLEDVGIEIDRSNTNHPRLVFKNDQRYSMVVAGTASDVRAGSNAAMEFCKMCL